VKEGNSQVMLLSGLMWTEREIPFSITKACSHMLKSREQSINSSAIKIDQQE
jgi:hypothetical protein